jgi:glycosyltransferase involved in cell wall biosynthesis
MPAQAGKREPMRISVCLCTRDEEGSVAKVIGDVKRSLAGHELEFVITDSSKDRTAEIAMEHGAKVIKQQPQGYGIALMESLANASGDVIITTDCDGTYPADAMPEMIRLIGQGYDVVSASRFKGKGRVEAMSLLNESGNRIFAAMVSVLYGCRCTDASTGLRAYRKEVIKGIEWTENTGLSLELFFKPAALGYKVTEVPISYSRRVGRTKLDPLKGGLDMLMTIMKYKIKPIAKAGPAGHVRDS